MKLDVVTRKPRHPSLYPPLLFVHGACHAAWCWEEHFLDFFATKGFDAYALSLRGHGRSEGRTSLRWTSVSDFVADIRAIASTLPSSPVLIGHSLGGLVVQKYLERYDAAGVVLLASSPVHGMFRSGLRLSFRHPLLFAKVYLTLDPGALYATPAHVRQFLFSDGLVDERIARYADQLGSESFRAFLDMTFDPPHVKRIRTKNRPMLVLGSTDDMIVTASEVEETARAYAAPMRLFDSMGHDMMLEDRWLIVAEHIQHWLEDVYLSDGQPGRHGTE